MRARRDAAIKLLKIVMVASVALPVALFSYASWVSYKSAVVHTDEQLGANLDIISEQANKIFQSIDLSFASLRAIVGDLSDDEIRAQEQTLHLKLRQLDQVLGAIDALAIVDKNGDALVSSSIYPVPRDLNVADRDYFKAHVQQDAGTYVGEVVTPRVRPNTLFGVSRRRAQNGEFAGAFIVFAVPKIFSDFYEKLALNQPGTSLALARGDGASGFPQRRSRRRARPAGQLPQVRLHARVPKHSLRGIGRRLRTLPLAGRPGPDGTCRRSC